MQALAAGTCSSGWIMMIPVSEARRGWALSWASIANYAWNRNGKCGEYVGFSGNWPDDEGNRRRVRPHTIDARWRDWEVQLV